MRNGTSVSRPSSAASAIGLQLGGRPRTVDNSLGSAASEAAFLAAHRPLEMTLWDLADTFDAECIRMVTQLDPVHRQAFLAGHDLQVEQFTQAAAAIARHRDAVTEVERSHAVAGPTLNQATARALPSDWVSHYLEQLREQEAALLAASDHLDACRELVSVMRHMRLGPEQVLAATRLAQSRPQAPEQQVSVYAPELGAHVHISPARRNAAPSSDIAIDHT